MASLALAFCYALTEGQMGIFGNDEIGLTYLPICYLPNKIVKDTDSDPSPYKNRKRTGLLQPAGQIIFTFFQQCLLSYHLNKMDAK